MAAADIRNTFGTETGNKEELLIRRSMVSSEKDIKKLKEYDIIIRHGSPGNGSWEIKDQMSPFRLQKLTKTRGRGGTGGKSSYIVDCVDYMDSYTDIVSERLLALLLDND